MLEFPRDMTFYSWMDLSDYNSALETNIVNLTCFDEEKYGTDAKTIAIDGAKKNNGTYIVIEVTDTQDFESTVGSGCCFLKGILTKENHKSYSIEEILER